MKEETTPMTAAASGQLVGHLNGANPITLAEQKRCLDQQRLKLFRHGYLPIPIYSADAPVKKAGKRPADHLWPHWRQPVPDEETICGWTQHSEWRSGANTGLLCGSIVGVDIDVPDDEIATRSQTLAIEHLGPGALVRVGDAPKVLLLYRCDAPFHKIVTPEFRLPNGQKAQVEILAEGQQFVAFGTHPDTQRPYQWNGPSPIDTPLEHLPVLTEKTARDFVAATQLLLGEKGALQPPSAKLSKAVANGTDASDHRILAPTPFTRVNSLALNKLDKWAPVLFPTGHFEKGTRAFRVPSSELDRGLEEDLSIHPDHGGRDFGEEVSCSPINIVMRFGPDAGVIAPEKDEGKLSSSALLWLCEQLDIEPASIGWSDRAGVAARSEGDALIAEMNKEHFVTQEGGKTVVVTERQEGGQRRLTRANPWDFERLYAHKRISIRANDNQSYSQSIGKFWFENPDRRSFLNGMIFDPSGQQRDGMYNLWTGFAVDPQPGNWDKFQQHIFNVVCSGDPDAFEYLINWLARMVQNPEKQGEVAIVMCGGEGAGKGIFARTVGKLFGQHWLHISQPEQLVGKFNEHCRELVFLFADEAFYAGDKRHVSVLKAIITEPTLMIEPKGFRAFPVRNHLHLFMASNDHWVIPASLDARRFCVLDVNNSKAGNRAWFDAIYEQMEHGGLAAMLYDLRHRDISGFNVRDVPQTDALNDQRIASLPVDLRWWLDVLGQEYVLKTKFGHPGELDRWHEAVSTDLLLESLNRFAATRRRQGAFSREELGRTMRKVGYGDADQIRMPMGSLIGENIHGPIRIKARPRGYRLGTLGSARSRFRTKTGLRIFWDK